MFILLVWRALRLGSLCADPIRTPRLHRGKVLVRVLCSHHFLIQTSIAAPSNRILSGSYVTHKLVAVRNPANHCHISTNDDQRIFPANDH